MGCYFASTSDFARHNVKQNVNIAYTVHLTTNCSRVFQICVEGSNLIRPHSCLCHTLVNTWSYSYSSEGAIATDDVELEPAFPGPATAPQRELIIGFGCYGSITLPHMFRSTLTNDFMLIFLVVVT